MERILGKTDKLSLHEAREYLVKGFEIFFQQLGYVLADPVDIYPNVDKTTIFVGSTISPLKARLKDRTNLDRGIYTIQPCLRTHTKDYFYDNNQISDYNSFFHQAGIIIKEGNYERVCRESFGFLTQSLGIEPNSIKIHIPSYFSVISRFWSNNFPSNIVTDGHPQKYYEWKYGDPGLTGLGITYSIKSEKVPEYLDIGNVIIIYKDGKEVGIEWGFGIETLLSRIYGLPKPQAASKICDLTSFEAGIKEKFLDTLVASVEMYKSGVEPSRKGGAMQILKTHLKALHYLAKKSGINHKGIQSLVDKYLSGCDNGDISKKIVIFLDNYEKLLVKYYGSIDNLRGSCLKSGKSPDLELEKLRNRLGIEKEELL